jgi:hypothetical protein
MALQLRQCSSRDYIFFPAISSQAETRCPANIAGVRLRIVAGALLVIPGKINHSGPFDFMVDTGSQLNVPLMVQLRLPPSLRTVTSMGCRRCLL